MTSAPKSEGTTTAAAGTSPPLPQLQQARRDFLTLVEKLRPDLHRYCARMVGSAIDGEDVVQDTLARGYYELSALREPPALRAWLFRIAHNRALDYLRRSDRRSEPLDLDTEEFIDRASDPDILLPREQAVTFAVARFSELAPTQRSCVILKDVLDYSLEEISDSLEMSVPAVKAALHRGRARLQVISAQASTGGFGLPPDVSPAVRRYAELFNARDWDGVRAMLIDDVRLEVVEATSRRGRKEVGVYFHNYDGRTNWYMVPARLDGREGLAVWTSADSTRATNFIELTVCQDQIARIRDFHHVPYLTVGADVQPAAIATHCR